MRPFASSFVLAILTLATGLMGPGSAVGFPPSQPCSDVAPVATAGNELGCTANLYCPVNPMWDPDLQCLITVTADVTVTGTASARISSNLGPDRECGPVPSQCVRPDSFRLDQGTGTNVWCGGYRNPLAEGGTYGTNAALSCTIQQA